MMNLKFNLIPLVVIIVTSLGCTSLISSPLTFELRTYRFCDPREIDNPAGKLCYRYCVKRTLIRRKCKEWDLDIQDLSDPDTHSKFMHSGFRVYVKQFPK